VRGEAVGRGIEVEEEKRSGSLKNKVRKWNCLLHVPFFRYFTLLAVFEFV
jgi:hypothetical protein